MSVFSDLFSFHVVLAIIGVIACIMIFRGIRLAEEDERFALLVFNRFQELQGPGLLMSFPTAVKKLVRIKLGQEGVFLGDNLARIAGAVLPVEGDKLEPGDYVSIHSFQSGYIHVHKIEPAHEITCPHCHHKLSS